MLFNFVMKRFSMNNGGKYQAFTLAEVLITLGIIGVVAALTIPTLIANYKKQSYVTGLKKAYSEYTQALMAVTADYDCPNDLKSTGLFTSTDSTVLSETFGSAVAKHLKLGKNCGAERGKGCISPVYERFDKSNNDLAINDNGNEYKFITADGFSYLMMPYTNCNPNWSKSGHGPMSQVCAELYIDVNGPMNGPSLLGRDVFEFWVTNGKGISVYPVGGSDDLAYGWWGTANNCSAALPRAEWCAAKVMEQGWQMNY